MVWEQFSTWPLTWAWSFLKMLLFLFLIDLMRPQHKQRRKWSRSSNGSALHVHRASYLNSIKYMTTAGDEDGYLRHSRRVLLLRKCACAMQWAECEWTEQWLVREDGWWPLHCGFCLLGTPASITTFAFSRYNNQLTCELRPLSYRK